MSENKKAEILIQIDKDLLNQIKILQNLRPNDFPRHTDVINALLINYNQNDLTEKELQQLNNLIEFWNSR